MASYEAARSSWATFLDRINDLEEIRCLSSQLPSRADECVRLAKD